VYYGTLAIACCVPGYPDDFSRGVVLSLVEAFARIDEAEMRLRPFPPLYQSGIRYKDDVEAYRASVCGTEACGDGVPVDEWQDAQTMVEKGTANCKDLVAYRLAELRLAGDVGAHAAILRGADPNNPGRYIYHVVLQRGDGQIEDPSAALGMKTPW
jgi:hypothetical protein